MPYNGQISHGWFPEEEPEPYQELAKDLLKGLLDDIFKIMQEKHRLQREQAKN